MQCLKGKKKILLQVQGLRSKVKKPPSQASVICNPSNPKFLLVSGGKFLKTWKLKAMPVQYSWDRSPPQLLTGLKKTCKLWFFKNMSILVNRAAYMITFCGWDRTFISKFIYMILDRQPDFQAAWIHSCFRRIWWSQNRVFCCWVVGCTLGRAAVHKSTLTQKHRKVKWCSKLMNLLKWKRLRFCIWQEHCISHNSTRYQVRNAEYHPHHLCGYQEVLWMEHSFYSGKAGMQVLG